MADPAALLASVETAISDIVAGKVASYTLSDGTTFTKLDLAKLMELRRTLVGEVSAAASSQGAMFEPIAFGGEG